LGVVVGGGSVSAGGASVGTLVGLASGDGLATMAAAVVAGGAVSVGTGASPPHPLATVSTMTSTMSATIAHNLS
jgi:hypothetical protein